MDEFTEDGEAFDESLTIVKYTGDRSHSGRTALEVEQQLVRSTPEALIVDRRIPRRRSHNCTPPAQGQATASLSLLFLPPAPVAAEMAHNLTQKLNSLQPIRPKRRAEAQVLHAGGNQRLQPLDDIACRAHHPDA